MAAALAAMRAEAVVVIGIWACGVDLLPVADADPDTDADPDVDPAFVDDLADGLFGLSPCDEAFFVFVVARPSSRDPILTFTFSGFIGIPGEEFDGEDDEVSTGGRVCEERSESEDFLFP